MKILTTIKPKIFESLGNGYWYYNYNIKTETRIVNESEEQVIYTFNLVRLYGKPTYSKCVRAIINELVDTDSEIDYINSYNAYLMGITDSDSEYNEYLQNVKEIKRIVALDCKRSTEKDIKLSPRQVDVVNLLQMIINLVLLTNQLALSAKVFYPEWSTFVGKELAKGTKVQYEDKLFEVIQTHTALAGWEPGIATASLFTEIVEDHSGTIDDPIPYPSDGNMVIYNGKYYIEGGVIYLCIRDSLQALFASLSALVGNYVQVALNLLS